MEMLEEAEIRAEEVGIQGLPIQVVEVVEEREQPTVVLVRFCVLEAVVEPSEEAGADVEVLILIPATLGETLPYGELGEAEEVAQSATADLNLEGELAVEDAEMSAIPEMPEIQAAQHQQPQPTTASR